MTDAPVQIPIWSRRRWSLAIALVLAFQAALILLLEKNSIGERPRALAIPAVQMQPDISLERFLVSDPTVFVLPHRNGFSGAAWLNQLPSPNFQPADWTEPPRALTLAAASLGGNFQEFTAALSLPQFDSLATIDPAPSVPSPSPIETPLMKSTSRIAGPLAQRRMLTVLPLRAWESADLVTNSVVQLLVDAEGKTISAVLLSTGLKLKSQSDADTNALELAKATQFEPDTTGAATVGTLTFEWQTLPPPSTNAPPEIP